MPVTDPKAVNFVNGTVTPLALKARAFKAEVDAAMQTWFSGVNVAVPDAADEVEGVSPNLAGLTGADVHTAMANLSAAAEAVNGDVVSKLCDRNLSAS